jgi:hypothetical protein
MCLLLLALAALACRDEAADPVGQDPASSLPLWARCENWRRSDHSCDQTALLADYEECARTASAPKAGRLARLRGQERAIIVCLERRRWLMNAAALRNLPGRPQPAGPPT